MKKLTPTQKHALAHAASCDGTLKRLCTNCPWTAQKGAWAWSTNTVNALVAAGHMVFDEWLETKKGKVAMRAKIIQL